MEMLLLGGGPKKKPPMGKDDADESADEATEDSKGGDMDAMKSKAADRMMAAIKKKDPKAFSDALELHYEACYPGE